MLVVGTSAMVRPAASLPLIAKHNGAYVVEIHVSLTPISVLIDASLVGRAGEVLPELVDSLLERGGGREPSLPGSSDKSESPSR